MENVTALVEVPRQSAAYQAAYATHVGLLASRQTHSFLLPENGEVLRFDSPVSLRLKDCHLPFDSVAIEYQASDSWLRDVTARSPKGNLPAIATVILAVSTGQEISVLCDWKFRHNDRQYWAPSPYGLRFGEESEIFVKEGGAVEATNVTPLLPHKDTLTAGFQFSDFVDEVRVLAHFLVLTNCTNVKPQRMFAPSVALVKRANERGNLPPDEYWTLDCLLGEVEERGADGGGSHASPRFHVRRGHVRRLPTGALTWVRQCTVGDASIGTIHKTYRVKESKACRA